jgi:hypothetical protein
MNSNMISAIPAGKTLGILINQHIIKKLMARIYSSYQGEEKAENQENPNEPF